MCIDEAIISPLEQRNYIIHNHPQRKSEGTLYLGQLCELCIQRMFEHCVSGTPKPSKSVLYVKNEYMKNHTTLVR